MTPQLQQAIRLLQLSSLELQTEIQDALDSNMMLEVAEDETPANTNNEESTSLSSTAQEKDLSDNISKENIPDELPVDTGWDEIYDGSSSFSRSNESLDFAGLENQGDSEKTLTEHLLWQLNLTPTTERDRVIAVAIIDALDEEGYLTCDSEDILKVINDDETEEDEVEAVLRLVQAMDPPGIAARDLQECLLLQLAQYPPETPWLEEATVLLENHLSLLGSHDYNLLVRRMKLSKDDLAEVVALIQSLNPRPGNQVQESRVEYITPDVYVRKSNGEWKVDLNGDSLPQLRINSNYANMIRRADNSNDNNSLKSHLQEARWFIKSLQSRSDTLLRVATSIVERQKTFLDYGEEAMKPLVLHDIAEELGMHESTISRVTTRKYMHTPRGVFELKYFFSSHVSTDFGGSCSSTAIRALIKKLIAAENTQKPLSDSKIASLLADQGIQVARRTVAKYREAMSIPPSNERKRLV